MAGKRRMGSKDMVMTMAVVLVVVGLIALYGNNVSFSPGSTTQGPAPSANVIDGFGHARATMGFDIVVPRDIPATWHANSFSVSDPSATNDGLAQVGTLRAVRGGWITGDDRFIQLTEAEGDLTQTLVSEFGSVRDLSAGTSRAGGADWTFTTGVRGEAAWVRTSGSTTFLITGNAPEADFRILAQAVRAQG